tara:strand:+ start:964 stop:1368 length:405 start_codon:yes stop_codon:yes gene_type:complete
VNIYYFAYGTNLNKKIFLKKFKGVKVIKKYSLKNFKVVFRTKYKIPDLQRKLNSSVPGVIYKINRDIEKKLDKYEEYPKIYIKRYFEYKNIKIMFYLMKKKSIEVKPSGYYFKIMMQGYQQNNFKFLNTFSKHH